MPKETAGLLKIVEDQVNAEIRNRLEDVSRASKPHVADSLFPGNDFSARRLGEIERRLWVHRNTLNLGVLSVNLASYLGQARIASGDVPPGHRAMYNRNTNTWWVQGPNGENNPRHYVSESDLQSFAESLSRQIVESR